MEVSFYHLTSQPLERVLPQLLEKTRERGWRAVVEVGDPERRKALDDLLWTYSERSFLAHGLEGDPDAGMHPILIAASRANGNGAEIRFLVDGARFGGDLAGYQRVALIFDGEDPSRLEAAREDWKQVKAAGHEAAYWRQDSTGRWERAL